MQLLKSIAAAALCVVLATVATTAQDMKFASFMATTHPYVAGVFRPFADKVVEATG
ncbi:MAG: hypothetical protein Q7T08_08950 [Devosia sp.]|nr:hypothetical protein [Devosia sp.]